MPSRPILSTPAPRAVASRANGRLSHGPTSPEGKERSRRNGCKDGLTGAGIVLPPAAAAEVARREAGFAQDLRPRNAVERERVRPMALGEQIIAEEVARLEAKREEVWEGVEQSMLRDWHAGVEMDLGPEGTRLRRYEAAADRMFRFAWTKLEQLRSERGEPLMPGSSRRSTPEPAPPPFPAVGPTGSQPHDPPAVIAPA